MFGVVTCFNQNDSPFLVAPSFALEVRCPFVCAASSYPLRSRWEFVSVITILRNEMARRLFSCVDLDCADEMKMSS